MDREMNAVAREMSTAISTGFLSWIDFKEGGKALVIENSDSAWNKAIFTCLTEKGLQVDTAAVNGSGGYSASYAYIIMPLSLEECRDRLALKKFIASAMAPDGHLLIAADNRFALRYLCGDRDPYTNGSFDGVDNYRFASPSEMKRGRCLADFEIREFIDSLALTCRRYSVLPSIKYPQVIYAEDYLPTEELSVRLTPVYNCNSAVLMDDIFLYTDIIKNKMFHQTANGYIYDCCREKEDLAPVSHVTLALDRGRSASGMTVIYGKEKVVKRAAYPEGRATAERIALHNEDLKAHGIKVVDGEVKDKDFVLPFIKADNGVMFFEKALKSDKELFIREMDAFRDIILKSAERVEEPSDDAALIDGAGRSTFRAYMPENMRISELKDKNGSSGIWLSKGYVDLVPLNAFRINDGFVFFDQEFCTGLYPANAIILRAVLIAYSGGKWMEDILPISFFYERYALKDRIDSWNRFQFEFLRKLRFRDDMDAFWNPHTIAWGTAEKNRKKLSYIELDERQLFGNALSDIEGKDVFIFGTGKYAGRFMEMHGGDIEIKGFLDNKCSENVSGSGIPEFSGHRVYPPSELKNHAPDDIRVIICIKDYQVVLRQLTRMGVRDIRVWDGAGDFS